MELTLPISKETCDRSSFPLVDTKAGKLKGRGCFAIKAEYLGALGGAIGALSARLLSINPNVTQTEALAYGAIGGSITSAMFGEFLSEKIAVAATLGGMAGGYAGLVILHPIGLKALGATSIVAVAASIFAISKMPSIAIFGHLGDKR